MSEDWDNEPVVTQPPQGRTFGMRGRGFRPVEKAVGLPNIRNCSIDDNKTRSNTSKWRSKNDFNESISEYNDSDDVFLSGSRRKPGENDKYKKNSDEFNDKIAEGKKSSQRYIPKEIPDEDLFSGEIAMGINFNKYDEMEVKVSGENVPKKVDDFDCGILSNLLLSNIKKCSYEKPTPIQKYALPIVLNGRDLIACGQTGSGKTAAFLIPILNCLLKRDVCPAGEGRATPQLIVVTPTRELARQIYVEAKKFTYGSKIKTEIAYGGTSVHYQCDKIRNGCNILIGTPGRLKDFLIRGIVSFSEIRHFVIDEADELLKDSFLIDMEFFFTHETMKNANDVQVLMFSATFSEKTQILAKKFLKNYLFLAVGIVGGACVDVEQKFYLVSQFQKRSKLIELLKQHGSGKTLVFVSKKRNADMLAAYLSEMDYPATSMHGDRNQTLREEALADFKSGKMDLLVATAVAARGLNIKGVSHVINFDLPGSIDEYVHRIGRTGRVGNRGLASSFYDPKNDSNLAPALVRVLNQTQTEVPEFLKEAGAHSFSTYGSSEFGGKDIRRRGGEDKDGISRLESVPTFEEEVW